MGVPVGLAHHLVHGVALGPLRGDALDAGAAAVHEDDVVVLRLGLVEAGEDGAGVADLLAAGDGDQRSLGQVRAVLAVLACALEVSGVDGGGGQRAGLAGVAAAPGAPDVAGLGAVVLGGGVAELLEGVAAVAEVLRAVGDELQLARLDLGAVLLALEVAQLGAEPVDGAIEAADLCPISPT